MKIVITESQLQELKYGYHASSREIERLYLDYFDVYFLSKINGEKIRELVGKVENTDKIKQQILFNLRRLEEMDFPVDESIGVLLYDYHLENLNNIKFNDKVTKIWVKKMLEEYSESILKIKTEESDGVFSLSDGYLFGVVRNNTLITILFGKKDDDILKRLRVDKIIKI